MPFIKNRHLSMGLSASRDPVLLDRVHKVRLPKPEVLEAEPRRRARPFIHRSEEEGGVVRANTGNGLKGCQREPKFPVRGDKHPVKHAKGRGDLSVSPGKTRPDPV